MLTIVVAWSLLVSFLVLQRVMRRGEPARSLQALPADRGSTRLLGAAFGLLALAAAPALNAYGVATMDFGGAAGWFGVAVMLGGLAVRLWSQAVLGRYYTSTLRHAADQPWPPGHTNCCGPRATPGCCWPGWGLAWPRRTGRWRWSCAC